LGGLSKTKDNGAVAEVHLQKECFFLKLGAGGPSGLIRSELIFVCHVQFQYTVVECNLSQKGDLALSGLFSDLLLAIRQGFLEIQVTPL
jgi:hypothetical protein